MEDKEKFTYGLDVDVYIQKAVDYLKKHYYFHWADVELFHKQYRYAIEKINGEYHYVRYTIFAEDDIERELLDIDENPAYVSVKNGDDFIRYIAADNEYIVQHANHVITEYPIAFEDGLEVDGWYLEKYIFQRLQTNDYSVFIQAGYRGQGGSRSFFIPPIFFTGSFEEFLEQYMLLVPGKDFGLYKEDLEKDEGLKKFLGF